MKKSIVRFNILLLKKPHIAFIICMLSTFMLTNNTAFCEGWWNWNPGKFLLSEPYRCYWCYLISGMCKKFSRVVSIGPIKQQYDVLVFDLLSSNMKLLSC